MWTNFFDRIYVLNLTKRTDRLLAITEEFEEYEIPFERVSAIEKPNGAEGLRDSMIEIFNEVIEKQLSNILIFEDDAKAVIEKPHVDYTMEQVIKQLPPNYWVCFLGGQPSAGFSNYYSANLFPAIKYFSTHSVMYSLQGVKEIMTRGMEFPIDNWMVSDIQSQGNCYAVNPLLFTQREGFSDICKNEINWNLFIEPMYQKKINELNARRT